MSSRISYSVRLAVALAITSLIAVRHVDAQQEFTNDTVSELDPQFYMGEWFGVRTVLIRVRLRLRLSLLVSDFASDFVCPCPTLSPTSSARS